MRSGLDNFNIVCILCSSAEVLPQLPFGDYNTVIND